MKATQILSQEHQVILRVITTLETAANAAEQGKSIEPSFFYDAADFIKGFADGCHHAKEENVLFIAMSASGMPVQGGPIGVMLADHEQGRVYTRAMRAGAEKWQAGEPDAKADVVQAARGYAALLRAHIHKEDNILFPMADRFIPADKQELVFEDFERVEHKETGEGVHEKYLALAEKLELDAGQWN
jgi:hemerythrin-like domain-containing protein